MAHATDSFELTGASGKKDWIFHFQTCWKFAKELSVLEQANRQKSCELSLVMFIKSFIFGIKAELLIFIHMVTD